MRFTPLVLSIILICSPLSIQAKMYKWVDEHGQVHFGDKIPQQYKLKKHEVMNERGLTVKRRHAIKTNEQIAEEKRLQEDSEKMAVLAEKQRKLDRVLLDAYDSERDLKIARDTRLDDVAAQIKLAQSNINLSNAKIQKMQKQVAQIKASNRQVPANLHNKIKMEQRQVTVRNRIIASNKKRGIEIKEKYNDYIKRYKAAKKVKK